MSVMSLRIASSPGISDEIPVEHKLEEVARCFVKLRALGICPSRAGRPVTFREIARQEFGEVPIYDVDMTYNRVRDRADHRRTRICP